MPQIVGETLSNIFQKAGIAADNPLLKLLLSSPELANVQVPDELVTAVDTGLLSIDAAKNNHPEIKKVYTAAAYDGMDKHLISILGSDTFDDADLAEIKNEKSTSKKYEIAISKLKAAKASAKGADKDEINRQLTAAHEAARIAKQEVETVRSEYEGKIKGIHLDSALSALISNYKTIFDELPGKAKLTAMKATLEQALQDKNAMLAVDENGNLTLSTKDGYNVFGSNQQQLTPQSFLDQSFAPILKVSGPPKPAALPGTPPPVNTTPGANTNYDYIRNSNDAAIAAFNQPSASLI